MMAGHFPVIRVGCRQHPEAVCISNARSQLHTIWQSWQPNGGVALWAKFFRVATRRSNTLNIRCWSRSFAPSPLLWCDLRYTSIAGCTFLFPWWVHGRSTHRLGHPLPSFPVSFFPFAFSPLPTLPVPSLPLPPGVCLFLPFAVTLQLSRCWVVLLCCLFCFALLLFCLPGLGSVCFLPPSLPFPFPLLCLLDVCSPACSLPLLCFPLFSCCCLSLAVHVPSFLPSPRCGVCVCKKPNFPRSYNLIHHHVFPRELQTAQIQDSWFAGPDVHAHTWLCHSLRYSGKFCDV